MKNFSQSFKTFWADEDGATAIEYGLLASLIALAIVAGATALGGKSHPCNWRGFAGGHCAPRPGTRPGDDTPFPLKPAP